MAYYYCVIIIDCVSPCERPTNRGVVVTLVASAQPRALHNIPRTISRTHTAMQMFAQLLIHSDDSFLHHFSGYSRICVMFRNMRPPHRL